MNLNPKLRPKQTLIQIDEQIDAARRRQKEARKRVQKEADKCS